MSTEVLTPSGSKELESTAIIAVDYGRLRRINKTWTESLGQLSEFLATTALITTEQEQWAADRMTEARTIFADLEADRQREVRPLIDQKTEIDSEYKKSTKPIADFIELIKKALAFAATERRKAEAALQLEAATLAAAGDDEGCQAALEVLPAAVKLAGASTTEKWNFRLVDISKVPAEYLMLNERGLKALCKTHDALNTQPTVPGLAFVREAHTRATARSTK